MYLGCTRQIVVDIEMFTCKIGMLFVERDLTEQINNPSASAEIDWRMGS